MCQLKRTLSAQLSSVNSVVSSATTCQLGCRQHSLSSDVLCHLSRKLLAELWLVSSFVLHPLVSLIVSWTLFYQLDCDLLVRLRSVSWASICQLGCCLSARLSARFCQLSAAIFQLSSTAMCYTLCQLSCHLSTQLSTQLHLVSSAVSSTPLARMYFGISVFSFVLCPLDDLPVSLIVFSQLDTDLLFCWQSLR